MESKIIPCCEEPCVHAGTVERVRTQLPPDEQLYDQSAVSHQLRVLKNSKLVKFRREGKTVYYSLADDHVLHILAQGMEHILE